METIIKFLKDKSEELETLEKRVNLTDWEAATKGTDKAYEENRKAKEELIEYLSDKRDFEFISSQLKKGISNPLTKRQLEILYRDYLPNQGDKKLLREINSLESEISEIFSTYRPRIDGKKVSMNDIVNILKKSDDKDLRQKAWEAQKASGKEIEKQLKELIKLRNHLAGSLGFKDYYEMGLKIDEIDTDELFKILDRVANITEAPFLSLKSEIDGALAKKRGKNLVELMPWDYEDPFFQEVPAVFETNLDKFYKGRDIVGIALSYYDSIGIDLHNVIESSDLFERPAKNPHAFETDIDRKGDIRILLNIRDTEYWMSTTLHELGHAAYSKYADKTGLPYLLREEAHTFTTEAVAMFFEKLTKNPHWTERILGLSEREIAPSRKVMRKYLRAEAIIFARWNMVMTHFERDMYKNPEQDLNTLWWKYVKKYQGINKPKGRNEPDWASKIHIALYPVYYHDYMLGELLECQFYHYIIKNIYGGNAEGADFADKPEIGRFFIEKVFSSGSKYRWDDMIKKSTGKSLNIKYFTERFLR